MAIKSFQQSIRVLFEQNHTFEVPKYQRGYAWDEEAVDDFIEDIARCLTARAGGAPKHHFFGGIVTVRKDVPNSNRSNYEVIDGQQRLASFVMLVAVVVSSMRGIVGDLVKKTQLSGEEKKAKAFLAATIETLSGLYLTYKDNVELEYVDVPKLTLSKADEAFFRKIIEGDNPVPERASHERIQIAVTKLRAYIDTTVLAGSASVKAKALQLLINGVLTEDCSVIFMSTETRADAYQIFQVLNDRGVHLTDGDLLRASTMEILDSKGLQGIQAALGERWDSVLAYAPDDVDSYLRWYFSSLEGKRPKSSDLAGQFLDLRFKTTKKEKVTKAEAQAILNEAKSLDAEFALLRGLGEGEWPYADHTAVTAWDRERLRMLVIHLKHTNAMPLLLSLARLEPKTFADAVATLERFVFRYKTIANAHIGPMTELYLRHAKAIRQTKKYGLKTLRDDLSALIQKIVPDTIFQANMREIMYSTSAGNGHIRYFLITLEDYAKWYEQGATGTPKCKDKSRVFDFSNTTLEHIYPQSLPAADQDPELEKLKHNLGNLTIFGPTDNDKLANKLFAAKRNVLLTSSLKLNRDIGQNTAWSAALVKQRTEQLTAMALKVFVP